jgi:DNA-binding transcriptional LysR family regulator
MNGECYIHRINCEFAGYADEILRQRGVTCKPVYWSERDDWTLAMVAAGLGFAFMPANSVKHRGVVGLPIVEPEFWREVSLVTVRERPYSPGVGSLVREAMRKKWLGKQPNDVERADFKFSGHQKAPRRAKPLQHPG